MPTTTCPTSAALAPLPWRVSEWSCRAETTILAGSEATPVVVCDVSGHGRYAVEDAVIAAHIVQAVNSHDTMLTALRLALTAIDSYQRLDGWQGETDATKAIRAAIAQAEGVKRV